MNPINRTTFPLACLAVAAIANAQDPRFLEWNIGMSAARLQSWASVQLKNLKKPGKVVGCAKQMPIDIAHAGINLEWYGNPFGGNTDVRFEIENPGKVTPGIGPITFAHKIAIKVGPGGKYGGYLKCQDTRFGIDMNFSAQPSYEWHVITSAPLAEGIAGNHKVALLNTKKRAFLVYQSRRIGFELGWWIYRPPLSSPAATASNPALQGYKSNIAEILPFLENLDKINKSETRFLRNFFGIKRYPG